MGREEGLSDREESEIVGKRKKKKGSNSKEKVKMQCLEICLESVLDCIDNVMQGAVLLLVAGFIILHDDGLLRVIEKEREGGEGNLFYRGGRQRY